MKRISGRFPKISSSGRSGFTLLEVLVAVAILSVVATTLLVIRNNAVAQSGEAFNLRVASALAARKMREIEMAPDPSTAMGGSEFLAYPGFRWDARLSELTIGKEIYLPQEVPVKEIVLTVTYPASRGESKSFQWVSLMPPPVELVLEEISEEEMPAELAQQLQKAGIPVPGGKSKSSSGGTGRK